MVKNNAAKLQKNHHLNKNNATTMIVLCNVEKKATYFHPF